MVDIVWAMVSVVAPKNPCWSLFCVSGPEDAREGVVGGCRYRYGHGVCVVRGCSNNDGGDEEGSDEDYSGTGTRNRLRVKCRQRNAVKDLCCRLMADFSLYLGNSKTFDPITGPRVTRENGSGSEGEEDGHIPRAIGG